jgi:riboflavin-specific deaminase-like protein
MRRPDETTVAGPQRRVLPNCYISDAIVPEPLNLKRLLPPGPPATAEQIVTGFELDTSTACGSSTGGRERPYVLLNMVSTADGHATLQGRSRALSGRADRELFHALRLAVDAVMAGANTVRVERYGRLIPDESRRRLRIERGLREEPLACIVSKSLVLPSDIPLLAEPTARVAIVTPSPASLPESAAEVQYVRAERDGLLDLPRALAELRERFGVRTLLCEGGPHLNAQLLQAGLVDELFLSLTPTLVGGDPAAESETLRILAGPALTPPVDLELLSVLEHNSHLFLRYGVRTHSQEIGAPPPTPNE